MNPGKFGTVRGSDATGMWHINNRKGEVFRADGWFV
jgi:hypothetical protein